MRKNDQHAGGESVHVLIVEDEKLVAWDLEQILREIGVQNIDNVSSLMEAVHTLQNCRPNYKLVLLDIKLPDGDGSELIPICVAQSIPVVVITGYSHFNDPRVTTIYKPYSSQELVTAILLLTNSCG
jgi:DNA-binding NtrC family response regulator